MMRPSPSAVSLVRARQSQRPRKAIAIIAASVSAKRPVGGLGAQQRIGNAGILGKDHIEERRQPHRLMLRDVIDVDQPDLIGLIDDERESRSKKPERPRRHAKSPSAFNSRKAAASRGVTSGKSGSLPT